ncbi:hypothetical protein, partial [Helicobacter heilmannii]|uniref:hypothetical protein n=1 Tax=Helicobacter heilmannii TaxID=35817 RepID=UPI0025544BA1
RAAFERIQTEVAEILGMERGQYKNNRYDDEGNLITKGTYRKRVEPRVYARLMKEQADPLRAQIAQLQATQAQEHQALNAICQQIAPSQEPQLLSFNECKQIIEPKVQEWVAINKALGDAKLYTKEDYAALRALKQEGITPDNLKAKIADLEKQIQNRQQKTQELEQQVQERQDLLDRQAPNSQDRQRLKYYSREKLIDSCISYNNQRILQQAEWLRNQEIINMLIARIEQNWQIIQEILAYLKEQQERQQENSPIQPKEQTPNSLLGAILSFLIKKISKLWGVPESIQPLHLSAHATEQANKAIEHDLYTQLKVVIQENQETRKEKNRALKELASLKKQLASSQTAPTQEPQKSTTR